MTGDQDDIFTRLRQLLPPWFGDTTPNLDAVLYGVAALLAGIYSLYVYAQAQTRILTATDGWLDLIAGDFFGSRLVRKAHESDTAFLARLQINMFRERATRAGLIQVLEDLTGRTPEVFEPARPADTGGYGENAVGYGVAGGYGSILLPYQAFLTAYRPANTGIPYVNGYGQPAGGYGVGAIEYAQLSTSLDAVNDDDIYAAVDAVKPAAIVIWTKILS